MKKILILLALLSATVMANLPPTTSKIDGDASKKTTFDFEFPNFTGTHVGSKVIISGASDLPVSGDITLTGSQFGNAEIGKELLTLESTGLYSGGFLSINAGNNALFDISAVEGVIIDSTISGAATRDPVSCPSTSGNVITNLATQDITFILIDASCAITQQLTFPTPAQRRAKMFIGRLNHSNRTSISFTNTIGDFLQSPVSQYFDLSDAIGPFVYANTAIITNNGANLKLNRSAGKMYTASYNYAINNQSPNNVDIAAGTAFTFRYGTQTALAGSTVSDLDPTQYDVGGVVTPLGGSGTRTSVQRVYLFPSGNTTIQYGQAFYSSLSDAIQNYQAETFVMNPTSEGIGVLIAYIVLQQNCTDLTNASRCKIIIAPRFGGSTGAAGAATTNLQQAYNNSIAPQIVTDAVGGAVDIKRGSAADTDNVLRIQNGAGVSKVDIKGNGNVRTEAPISAYNLARDNNLLVNGSFEDVTYTNGWTCSLGSTTLETTAKTDGNQANAINSIGAGVRCYQTSTTNAANLKGLLGSAIVKIKTTDSIYKVCGLVDGNAAANERNCITVNPTSTDLPFYPARTDFYMGGTSNGIVVYTTTTTSQPTVIDDAFVGVFNGGLSQFSNNTSPTPCTFSSLAWTGFGTVTNNLICNRVGNELRITGSFTNGTVVGNTATMPLPTNFGTIAVRSFATNTPVGAYFRNNASVGHGGAILSSTSTSTANLYFSSVDTFGSVSRSALTTVIATDVGNTGEVIGVNISVPIAGWEANTNAAIAGCVDAFGCTDTFTAFSSATGVISNPNVTGWVSNASSVSAGVYTFPIRAGMVTGKMNCTATAVGTTRIMHYTEGSSSTTQIVFTETNTSTTINDIGFIISCQKGTADFKPKTVVVSPLQGYVKVPGAENLNVESFRVSFGAAATTVCSSTNANCAYNSGLTSNSGTIFHGASAGLMRLDVPKTYTRLICDYSGFNPSSATALGSDRLDCSNCNSDTFTTVRTDTSAAADSYGTVSCTGTY